MHPLSVALLSWEYPPAVVGGLSRHVHGLARGLAASGHAVTVYTGFHADAPPEQIDEGVRIVRAEPYPPDIPFSELIPWVLSFNLSLLRRAEADLREQRVDVLHGHDWLVAYAAVALRDLVGAPLVSTIHATEHGRHGGRLRGRVPRFVHEVERWLTAESRRVITCSDFMRREVGRLFGLAPTKVETIRNEIEPATVVRRSRLDARRVVAENGEPVLLYAGRLEYEKGLQTLLEALPLIDRRAPGVRLVVAGTGSYRGELEDLAVSAGLSGRVRFDGFVREPRLAELYAGADAVVVPSLYEPFGLVAIEAMASGTPVVASDTGGLRELVEHGSTGLLFAPGDARSLAAAAVRVLTDRELAARLVAGANRMLEARGTWRDAAARTADIYRAAVDEHAASPTVG